MQPCNDPGTPARQDDVHFGFAKIAGVGLCGPVQECLPIAGSSQTPNWRLNSTDAPDLVSRTPCAYQSGLVVFNSSDLECPRVFKLSNPYLSKFL